MRRSKVFILGCGALALMACSAAADDVSDSNASAFAGTETTCGDPTTDVCTGTPPPATQCQMVVCSGGSWSFTPGDEDMPCSTGSGAAGSCHDGACVAAPTCSTTPPVVDPCVALYCDPMGSWIEDTQAFNGMACSIPSSGVVGTCSSGTCVPSTTSDDGGTGTPPIITIPPGGGTGGGGDADGGTTTPPIGTGDGGAGGPGPGGTQGPPNARCDNNFSFPECRGLLIGQVSANNNICASGGPSFPDGSWDCNILIPKPNPNPNPVGDAGVTDGGDAPDTGTGTITTDAGAPPPPAPPPATTAIPKPVYKAFTMF